MRWVIVLGCLAASAAGCVSANNVQCEDGRVCPQAQACDTTHHLCVDPTQLTDCADVGDREACMIGTTPGTCQQGTCLPSGCGNGRPDLVADEVCDDGNNTDGDGCSANCRSNEQCGNTTIDVVGGEVCDDGNHLDHDGCSSACQDEQASWVRHVRQTPLSVARAVYDAGRDRVVVYGGKLTNDTVDGKTKEVSEWDGQWHTNIPVTFGPLPRDVTFNPDTAVANYGLVYDAALGLTVLAGGQVNFESTTETWGWDGARWTQLPGMPAPRERIAMAYDSKRKLVVVFGGRVSGSVPVDTDDMWTFDGTTWSALTPTNRPPARAGAQMVYDAKRDVLVMYGGISTTNELWEYVPDTNTWTKIGDGTSGFPGLYGAAMTYDPASGKTLIYGNPSNSYNEMYLWDGSNLVNVLTFGAAPASTPVDPRLGAFLVPDGTGRVMLYGGELSNENLLTSRLTWFYDVAMNTWTEVVDPPALELHSVVEERNAGALLRVGGFNGGTVPSSSTTWELTRRGWTKSTVANPPGLVYSGLAYDSDRREAVLFGGANASFVPTNRTWTRMPGGAWVEHTPVGAWPTARWSAAMVYDAARKQTILFGGATAGSDTNSPDQMWIWNGATANWIEKTGITLPPSRTQAAMGYDPVHQVVVLYGGGVNNSQLGDTWIWDGTTWTDVTSTLAESPGQRSAVSLAWNPARQSLVLSPSFNLSDVFDAWEWRTTSPTSGTWTRIAASNVPGAHAFGALFSTLDGSGVTYDGGAATSGLDDARYELRWQGPRASDSCQRPEDIDGDTLAVCASDGTPADPDCWRVCTPDCPPGTSCAADSSQCGDGVCTTAETCRSCPQDCSACTPVCGDLICDTGETCAGDCP